MVFDHAQTQNQMRKSVDFPAGCKKFWKSGVLALSNPHLIVLRAETAFVPCTRHAFCRTFLHKKNCRPCLLSLVVAEQGW
jgi:hypothetical protein